MHLSHLVEREKRRFYQDAMENAADATGDAVENAAEATGDAVDNAASATGEAVEVLLKLQVML